MNQQLIDELLRNKNSVYEKHKLVINVINEQEENICGFIDNRINRFNVIIDQADLSSELDNTLVNINDFYINLKGCYEQIENRINSGNNSIQDLVNYIKDLIIQKENDFNKVYNIPLFTGKKSSIMTLITRLNNIAENASEEVIKQKNELIEEFNNIDNSVRTEFDSINEKQDQINDSIDKKFKEYELKLEDKINELDEVKNDYEEQFAKYKEESTKTFDDLARDIEEKDKKISGLIGLIGNKANIGEYKSNADKAHTERIIWQVLTVLIFFAAFGLMVFITLNTTDYNIATLARYIVSVILLGMSGYTGKQASNQRKDEVYYRKQQLELSSIDVYLDSITSEEIKTEIKKDLSSRIFGQANETYKSKYDDNTNETLDKIVKLIENLSTTIKK